MKKTFFLFLVLLNFKNNTFSQEIKESEGSIENAQILIEKNKIIKLPEVIKPGKDTIEKKNESEIYKISITPKELNFKQEKIKLEETKNFLIDKKIFKINENTFSFKYGNYKSIFFNSYHSMNILDNLKFDASINHNSNKKGSINDEKSGFYDSKILFNSYFNYSKIDFELNIGYNRIKTFYYGFIDDNIELISKDDIDIRNNFINYDISISGNLYEKIIYKLKFNNVNFNSFLFNEYVSIIESEISYNFNKEIKTSLFFDNYYRNLKKNNTLISNPDQNKNNMLLTYLINYKLKNYDLNVGFIYDIDTKNQETDLYAKVNLSYFNSKGYYFKLFLDGGDDTNFYYDRIKENPFLYDLNFNYLDLVEKLNYGVILGSRLFNNKGNINISYNVKKLNNFFVYGKSTDDEVLSNGKIFDVYRYTIFYDSGNVSNRKLNLYLDYSKNKFINSSLIFVLNNYSLNNFSKPSNLPKYEVYLSNVVNINDFIITGKISSYIETYSIDIINKVEKLENYLSIDFDINYSIFENTKITLNLNNILDSKNEIYYKYQDLGFNLKLGFIYSLK